MCSFARRPVIGCLAGTFLALTLPVSGVLAAKMGTSPQTIGPCGPVIPPEVRCGIGKVPFCVKSKSVVSGGKTFTCCAVWACWPKHGADPIPEMKERGKSTTWQASRN